jgi:hypothetical protein
MRSDEQLYGSPKTQVRVNPERGEVKENFNKRAMKLLEIHSHWFYTDHQSIRSNHSILITLPFMWYYRDLSSNLISFDGGVERFRKHQHQRFFLEIYSSLSLAESVLDIYFVLLFCTTVMESH